MDCIGSAPARAVARRIVLHELLRDSRTATSPEVWVVFGVEYTFGSSLDTFSAGSPMSCQDGTVKVKPPPASKIVEKVVASRDTGLDDRGLFHRELLRVRRENRRNDNVSDGGGNVRHGTLR